MIFPTYDDGGAPPELPIASWTFPGAVLDAESSISVTVQLSAPAGAPLSVGVSVSALPTGASISFAGGGPPAAFGAAQTSVVITVTGSALLEDGSFTLTVDPGTGYTVGSPSVVTVTTFSAQVGSNAEVGVGWVGGIPSLNRQTQSVVFQPPAGILQPNYSVNAERCQIDVMAEAGNFKNAMITGFAGDGDTFFSVENPAPAPAEAGVYDRADPWAGMQVLLTGLPDINGVTSATADLSAPESQYVLLGQGARGNSGADLFRQDARLVPFTNANSGRDGRPGSILVSALNRVDLPCVVYEIMYTSATVAASENPCLEVTDAVDRVDFDEMLLVVPSGYQVLILDAFSGNGGSNGTNRKIIKTFNSSQDSHSFSPGELPGWTIAVYDPNGCTEAQAQALLEAQDCGAVIDGPQALKQVGGLRHPFLDWRKGPAGRTKSEINERAQYYRDKVRAGVLLGTADGGLFPSERIGKHIMMGRSGNGGSSGQGIHYKNEWNTAAPMEMSCLRYWVEAMSRRISEAIVLKEEARTIFGGDFVVTAQDPQSTQSPPVTKEWSLCANRNTTSTWRHLLPCFTRVSISDPTDFEGRMDYSGHRDDSRNFPAAPSGQRESVLHQNTSAYWGHITSHQHRFSVGREAWIFTRSFIGYNMISLIAGLGDRYIGAREAAYAAIGAAGFYSPVYWSTAQNNMGRILASAGERPKLPGGRFDLISRDTNGTTQYATGNSAFSQDQFTGRPMAVPMMHIVDAYSVARTQSLRDLIHPPMPAPGTRPENDYSSIRAFVRAHGWMTNDYGMMSFYDRGGDPSDPYGANSSNPGNGTLPIQRRRHLQERKGYLAGGENRGPSAPGQNVPDGILRWNYDEEPVDDAAWHQNYNVWQHTYHAIATAAAINLLLDEGVPSSDPLIQDALPVAVGTMFCMKAHEGHPAATSGFVPMPRYAPCSAGNGGRDDASLTKAEFLAGGGSWWYTAGDSDWHYFAPALALTAQILPLIEYSAGDIYDIAKKLLALGDVADPVALADWQDRLWDLGTNAGAQHHRNESGMLAWALEHAGY